MAAYIKFDGVDGESDPQHSESNLEMIVKVLDGSSGTFYGAMSDVEYTVTVTDTQTSAPAADRGEVQSLSIVKTLDGASGGIMVGLGDGSVRTISPTEAGSDPIGPFFAYDASFPGGVDVPASSTGDSHWRESTFGNEIIAPEASGPMKESMETMKKAWTDASGPVDHGGDLGADDLVSAGADAAALGNTYLGMTTIEQGVLEVEHSAMTLSFQYDLA